MTSNIGSPQQQSIYEQEQAAFTQNQRTLLGIAADTLAQSFTKIGYQNTWKYQSDSGNPTLAPMTMTRLAGTPTSSNEAWQAQFDALVNMLPADVLQTYLQQAQLPADQRDPSYVALDSVLGAGATVLSWTNSMPATVDPNSLAYITVQQNLLLPDVMQATASDATNQALGAANDYLETVGYADPNRDALAGVTGQLGVMSNDFNDLVSKGSTSSTAWSTLADNLSNLNTNTGNTMQVLGDLTDNLQLSATASASQQTISPAFLMNLVSAMSFSSSEPASSIQSVAQSFSGNMLATWASGNQGSATALPAFLTGVFLAASVLGNVGSSNPEAVGLGLQLLDSSGLLSASTDAMAKTVTGGSSSAPVVQSAINTAAMAILLRTMAKANMDAALTVMDATNNMLSSWLEQIQEEAKQATESFKNAQIQQAFLHMQLLATNLDHGDYEGAMDSINKFYDGLHAEKQGIADAEAQETMIDKNFNEFVKTLKTLAGDPGTDMNNATVIHMA